MVGEFTDDSAFVQAKDNNNKIIKNMENFNPVISGVYSTGQVNGTTSGVTVMGSIMADKDLWVVAGVYSGAGGPGDGYFGVHSNGSDLGRIHMTKDSSIEMKGIETTAGYSGFFEDDETYLPAYPYVASGGSLVFNGA